MSAPAGNGTTDEIAIEVDGDDSPLSPASPEVVPLQRWDDLERSYRLNHNLMHKFIPNFSLEGPSSSSSSARVVTAYRTNQIVLIILLTRIGTTLQPHELYEGSRGVGAPTNLGLGKRFWRISFHT